MPDHSKTRTLTYGEARVAWKILSCGLDSEEERMRQSGLPRTTYRVAKHRLYTDGLLVDRYIPSTDEMGVKQVTFLLVRPRLDEARFLLEKLCSIPGAVEVWSGTQMILAVIFHQSENSMESLDGKLSSGELGSQRTVVEVKTDSDPAAQVPVYFDFEGMWARYCGISSTKNYPSPIPAGSADSRFAIDSSRSASSATGSLLARPFVRPSHLAGPNSVPRSQRRALREGKVVWRVFLGLTKLQQIDYRGMRFQDLILVVGKPKGPDPPSGILTDLVTECNVRPILIAGDEGSMIVASLGIGVGAVGDAPEDTRPRSSVIKTMSRHLKEIEVIREPLKSLKLPVAHRYDLLVS